MIKTKLNCYDRDRMTYKMQSIYHLAPLKMFVFCCGGGGGGFYI